MSDLAVHIIEIRGTELEGFWFACACEVEGKLYDQREPAEMEGAVHELIEFESA